MGSSDRVDLVALKPIPLPSCSLMEFLYLSAFLLMELLILLVFVRYSLNWWIFVMQWLWELPLHLA